MSYPAEAGESNSGSRVCERDVERVTRTGPACLAVPVTGCLAGVGRVLSSVAAGHPEGTRSALDGFRETFTVDRRVRGDVPPHPLPSGERLFLIFSPMKPRLAPVVVAPAALGSTQSVLATASGTRQSAERGVLEVRAADPDFDRHPGSREARTLTCEHE